MPIFFTGLDLINPPEYTKKLAATLSADTLKHARRIRGFALVNGALVATTVVSGAFVAGNNAGMAYNTFPLMGDVWVPQEILEMEPKWRNLFENTCTVQFDHRYLAMTTMSTIWGMYVTYNRRQIKYILSYTKSCCLMFTTI
jgi:cytochrome c oxidase assembly protein subunit 15